jgi:hypothetical protein
MDGVRVDPAAMASDKDHLPSACVMPGMPESAVPGLDDGSRPETMASEAVAAVAEGLSKELSALDPSLAVMMQSGIPAAACAQSPPPPPDVPGAMMHGLLPPGAEGLLGGMGVPPPAAGGMLGALTAVPAGVVAGSVGSVSAAAALSKVGELGGGIKDDKTPALDAAGKALKEQKKVRAPPLRLSARWQVLLFPVLDGPCADACVCSVCGQTAKRIWKRTAKSQRRARRT